MKHEHLTWYVLVDGTNADPNDVAPDGDGVLRHENGLAVALREDGTPMSVGVATREGGNAEAAQAGAAAPAPVAPAAPVVEPPAAEPAPAAPPKVAAAAKPAKAKTYKNREMKSR